MTDDDEFSGCGWEWDHRYEVLSVGDDGIATYLCRECGAETFDATEDA